MGYIIPSQSDRPHGHQQSTQAHGPRRPPRQREAGVPTPWDPRTINLSHGNLPPPPLASPQTGDSERLWKALSEPDPFPTIPPPDPPRASPRPALRRNNRLLVPLSPSGPPPDRPLPSPFATTGPSSRPAPAPTVSGGSVTGGAEAATATEYHHRSNSELSCARCDGRARSPPPGPASDRDITRPRSFDRLAGEMDTGSRVVYPPPGLGFQHPRMVLPASFPSIPGRPDRPDGCPNCLVSDRVADSALPHTFPHHPRQQQQQQQQQQHPQTHGADHSRNSSDAPGRASLPTSRMPTSTVNSLLALLERAAALCLEAGADAEAGDPASRHAHAHADAHADTHADTHRTLCTPPMPPSHHQHQHCQEPVSAFDWDSDSDADSDSDDSESRSDSSSEIDSARGGVGVGVDVGVGVGIYERSYAGHGIISNDDDDNNHDNHDDDDRDDDDDHDGGYDLLRNANDDDEDGRDHDSSGEEESLELEWQALLLDF